MCWICTAVPHVDPQTRGRVVLPVVLVITAIIIGTAIALFLFKKSGRRLPIPEKLTTFDNPLFFNNERHRSEMVDTNKLVANAEEENPGPVVTVWCKYQQNISGHTMYFWQKVDAILI